MSSLRDAAGQWLGVFDGFGKECYVLILLVAGIVFRCRDLINGAQFVDLAKSLGVAYLASHAVNTTWGASK